MLTVFDALPNYISKSACIHISTLYNILLAVLNMNTRVREGEGKNKGNTGDGGKTLTEENNYWL